MEPIKISSLPKQLVELILSDPKTYNFNDSSIFDKQYLDEQEIGVLLKQFNKKDPADLYKIGMDTFKSEADNSEKTVLDSDTEKADEVVNESKDEAPAKAEEQKEEAIEEVNDEVVLPEDEPAEETKPQTVQFGRILNMAKRDNASRELVSGVSSEVNLNGPDNALNPIHEAAASDSDLQDFIENIAGEMQKVEDEFSEAKMTEESKVTYKDQNGNDKVINIRQSVSLGGFVQKEKIADSESEGDDKQDEAKAQDENNLSGGIHYTLLANTENTKLAFQAHVDNTDQDFLGYVIHNKTLKNGEKLDLTGSGRVTLDQEQLIAGGGLAVDYSGKDNKFSAGALARYTYETTKTTKSYDYEAEAFVKYKEIGGVSAHVIGAEGIFVPSVEGNIYGNKSFDNGISVAGALSTEVGYVSVGTKDFNYKAINTRVEAKGALTFQAGSDISANVDGMVVYENLKEVNSSEKSEHTLGGILRGSFKKGKTEVYGVGCAYKNLSSDDTLITGAATFGIQINDLMKPGIAGFVEGTVCNTNANHNPDSSINGIKVGSRINF